MLTFTKKGNDSITMEHIKMTKWLYYFGTDGVLFVSKVERIKLECENEWGVIFLYLKMCYLEWDISKEKYSFRPTKIVPFFHFHPSHKVYPISLFNIFASGSHIPLTHSYSYFIIKLIYKSRTYISSTFLTQFSLHFLKLVPL